MLTARLAWRNLWRNGRRTAITMAAVTFSAAISIVTYSLMGGLAAKMMHKATRLTVGDVQIHAPGYREDRSIYKALADPQRIVDEARARGALAVERSYGFGLVALGSKSAGAMFWGLDPEAEAAAFELPSQMLAGRFLPDGQPHGIVLGRRLAVSLQADVGSEIVVMVQAADGSLGNEVFHVTGILKAVGEDMDRTAAIIQARDFTDLFVSGGRVHEIALNGTGRWEPGDLARAMAGGSPGTEVLTWRQLLPQFASLLEFWNVAVFAMGIVFALAAGLGVVNTMLMAAYERIWEFGVLKALGTAPWRIVGDVAAEAFLLSVVSTAAGAFIGCSAAALLQIRGIDLSRFVSGTISLSGVAFDPVLRPALSPATVLFPVLVTWAVCVIAALYPAIKAARIDPVRAMTHV